MWRSLWQPADRFSLHHFKNIINNLQRINVVDNLNREVVINILQSIVEIVTYGDKHDPSIFECFMECQVLAEFVRLLKTSRSSRIEAPLLQYLSIMIQNLLNYCFSNEYINSIITHDYNFEGGDLAPYYVSFLRQSTLSLITFALPVFRLTDSRTVSSKVNRDTLCLLVKVEEDRVVSFPLYSEALRFAHHGEKMIQTAIRALTLNIYNVSDDMVYQFITTTSVSIYFDDLVLSLREQCLQLDSVISTVKSSYTDNKRNNLLLDIEKFLDDLYYVKDVLSVGESRLCRLVTQKLLGLLVVPIMVSLMHLNRNTVVNISATTSFFILSRLVQVIDRQEILNSVASLILYPHLVSSKGGINPANTNNSLDEADRCSHNINQLEQFLSSSLTSIEDDQKNWLRHTLDSHSSNKHPIIIPLDNVQRDRTGIMPYIFSDNEVLLLASLMLLLILAESKDLDSLLSSAIGFSQTVIEVGNNHQQHTSEIKGDFCSFQIDEVSSLKLFEESIFMRCMPEIFNALLKHLGSSAASSVTVQLHTGWFLQKLLAFQRATLSHQELHLFNVRMRLIPSFEQSRRQLVDELNGSWFDHIPDAFRKEWASCKMVLKESTQNKDPFFILELSFRKQFDNGNDIDGLQRMLHAVKIFVLLLHLRAYVSNGCPPDDPAINLKSKSQESPRRTHFSDTSSANFGSEVPIGSGFPCKIAFSSAGVHDIFVIPVSKGLTGKLLLVEKHPFHSRNGIVIAKAPLAGLSPKMDENHATWLHLRIREPSSKQVGKRSNLNTEAPGRWTLGFPNIETCTAAYESIMEETRKQRSSVETFLAPFLYDDNYRGNIPDGQGN
ncbi:hypothetical protein V2J09_016692 [Rumex salicifolius]